MDPLMELMKRMNETLARYQGAADRVRELQERLDAAGSSRAAARIRVDLEEAEAEMRALNAEMIALQTRIEEERERRLRERIPINPRRMESREDAIRALKEDFEDVREAARVLVERLRAAMEDWVVAKRRHGAYAWDVHMVVAEIEAIIADEARDLLRLIPGTLIHEYQRKP
jgi:predicted  nucleic acid-binding Zn-ribbon protein